MVEAFKELNPTLQAFLAGCFTWAVTSLGAAAVFLAKGVSKRVLDFMLGAAAGVMIAASFWSLLAPAIEMAEGGPLPGWVPALIGFLLGGAFLRLLDRIVPHLHLNDSTDQPEGLQVAWRRSILMVLAIALHNIPEGLAVGVAFGALAHGHESATFGAAAALALGIGIQNFPEGLAVSMPLRRAGMSRLKSFWYGQLSGFVEPISAVIGAALVIVAQPILPYALAFAAGAMIFVVVEEVIPESHTNNNVDLATGGVMIGFAVMMTLDVALG